MARKKRAAVQVEMCECSTCKQVARVEPGKEHAYCRGFGIVKPLPAMFADLKNPKRMGKWVPIQVSVPSKEEVPEA